MHVRKRIIKTAMLIAVALTVGFSQADAQLTFPDKPRRQHFFVDEASMIEAPERAAIDKIDQTEWNAVRDVIIEAIKANKPGEGLVHAVRKCGELLAPDFPVEPGDVNEIANEGRILD